MAFLGSLASMALAAFLVLGLYHTFRRTGRAARFFKYALAAFVAATIVAALSPSAQQPGTKAPAPITSAPTSGKESTPPQQSPGQGPVPATVSEAVTGKVEAHFLDVGQGDACFVRLPDDTIMLIDAGPAEAGNKVATYLAKLGIKKIDYLIFTHPHADHIGGGPAVLEAFSIGAVYMPRATHTTRTYENLLLAIEKKGLKITEAKAGKVVIDKPNLKAHFIGPLKNYTDLNDMSGVLALEYNGKGFLFTGDASSRAEGDMVAAGAVPDVEVLKVGHHGSSISTSLALLKAATPSTAVISVGAGNPYGHPSAATLDRLIEAGAKVYRTDLNGTIVVTTDGKTLVANVEREASTTTVPPPPALKQATQPSASEAAGSITVYITRTGSKYHRAGCRYLSKSAIPISLEDAKARGYTPCSVCKPPR